MGKRGDFSKVFNNSFFLITNEVIDGVVNLVVIAILVRYFDLETFGNYSFIFVLCNIFQVMTGIGMNSIIIREVAKRPEVGVEIFNASIFTRILFSFITFGIIALSINLSTSSPEIIRATYVCAGGVITLFFYNLPFSIFQGYQRMEFVPIVGMISNLIYLATTLAFVKFGAGLQEIFFPVIIGNILGFLLGLYILGKKFFVPKFSLDLKLCKYLVKESYLIGIGRFLRKISFRFDTILIKMIRGSIEVALFSGPYRLFLQLTFIPNNIVMSIFPVFSRKYAKRADSLNFAFKECFKIFAIFLIPLVIFLFFFAQDIVMLIFGKKLIESVPVFKILSLAWGFMFISVLFVETLIAVGKQNLTTLCIALALIVNVILDVILIPTIGFYGAGLATFAAEVILTFSTYKFISRNLISLPFARLLPGPAIGGLFLAIFCYLGSKMSWATLFSFTVFGFLGYIGSLILFKTLTSQEYEWGKEIFRGLFMRRASLTDSGLSNPGKRNR
jgi:O-antigen/teichoic acid export membrane protein